MKPTRETKDIKPKRETKPIKPETQTKEYMERVKAMANKAMEDRINDKSKSNAN